MKNVLISDGITEKKISFDEFSKTQSNLSETYYPFVSVGNERFYYNQFLFV